MNFRKIYDGFVFSCLEKLCEITCPSVGWSVTDIFVLVYAVAGWIIYDYSRVRKKREEMILTYP